MPQGFLDRAKIAITCPNCRRKISERIGRLKKNPELVCPGCGRTIQIEGGASLDQANRSLEKSVAALNKTIGDFNKRSR